MSRCCCGLARSGGKSPSSSSAMDAVRPLGVDIVKSSSNIDLGEIESESNRNRVAGESPSLARIELPDTGDAVVSSGSKANLKFKIHYAFTSEANIFF